MSVARVVVVLLAVAAYGCGDDDGGVPADAGGGSDGGGADGGAVGPTAPAAPTMTPCPEGWSETTTPRGTVWCDPFPAGATDCTGAEAHFPGGTGCERVGSECPAGDFPEGLPAGVTVVYVRAGAPSGGDGSMASPFGTIRDATRAARAGEVIALAKGTYDENVQLGAEVTLWGACVAETTLTSSIESTSAGVVSPFGRGAIVRNLRIADARRPATFADAGTAIELVDVVVENVEFAGMIAYGGGTLVARNVVVRDTVSRRLNRQGGSPLVVLDSNAEVYRAVFERNVDLGIVVDGPGTTLVEDTVVRDVAPQDGTGLRGRGIEVATDAVLELRRVAVIRAHEIGVVSWLGGTLRAEDLVVRGTQARASDGMMGPGFTVGRAVAECRRCTFVGNWASGAVTQDADLLLEDAVILDTLPNASGNFGRGLEVQFSGNVQVRRAAFEGNHEVGIFAGGDGLVVRVEDVTIRDTASDGAGYRGRAIETIVGGTVEVTRGVFEGNREVSLMATDAHLRLFDVRVTDTLPRACAEDGTCDPAGSGLGSYGSSTISAERFVVERASLCGVQLARGGAVDLSDGVVRDSEFGACVQVDGYDLGRLQDDVRYEDNGANLESTTLPVPDASGSGTVNRS